MSHLISDVERPAVVSGAIRSIKSIADEVIHTLPDPQLVSALAKAFEEQAGELKKVEHCFTKLTQHSWPRSTLEHFFFGWRETHLTTNTHATLVCRILLLADQTTDAQSAHLYRETVGACARVMHEDLGLDGGSPHAELYRNLANALCEGEEWELPRNRVLSTYRFRNWVSEQRGKSPEIRDGICSLVASEVYNHAEYAAIEPLFQLWIERDFGYSANEARRLNTYVTAHTGHEEVDHFMACVNSLLLYCKAAGIPMDYQYLSARCSEFLRQIGAAFEGLSLRLN